MFFSVKKLLSLFIFFLVHKSKRTKESTMRETRDIDTPELPFKKPKLIEKLEKLGFDQREAMDGQEMKDRINEVAYNLAETYQKKIGKNDFDGCLLVVNSALSEMAHSMGGKFGALMAGMSDKAAENACKAIFYQQD
jgi:hypothetical protein